MLDASYGLPERSSRMLEAFIGGACGLPDGACRILSDPSSIPDNPTSIIGDSSGNSGDASRIPRDVYGLPDDPSSISGDPSSINLTLAEQKKFICAEVSRAEVSVRGNVGAEVSARNCRARNCRVTLFNDCIEAESFVLLLMFVVMIDVCIFPFLCVY